MWLRNRMLAGLVLATLVMSPFAFGGQKHIEVVSKGFQHDFWKEVHRGCVEAGEKFGATVNFVGPVSETDTGEQIALLAQALAATPDAICIAALSPEPALLDLVFQASDADIPVITFDSDIGSVAGDDVQAFVATDNRDAGAHATQEMYDKLKDTIALAKQPLRIGVLSQDTLSQSIGDRTFGFIEKMVHLCGPDVIAVEGNLLYEMKNNNATIILEIGIPDAVADAEMDSAARLVLEKPNLIGVYASNEFAAKSMLNANASLKILGPDKVIGIGFDSGLAQVEAVRERLIYGSITQNPFMIGFITVKTAIEAAKGEAVKDVTVPYYFYTADNMDEPDIAHCVYE